MNRSIRRTIHIVIFLPLALLSQGTYYNSIDTGSANFVTNLHNLINPHTRITYDQFDETNVANFASRDTTSGQKAVTCVYSGENYVYTPPFTWAVYSREHTWCQSWMPSAHASGFTNLPEYSDQHHLFPTNQNKANAIRSNHPEGIVVSASYTYLSCKLGTDASGHTVFEPRPSHKGDAARALLYMALCYNGVSGYDWTFNNLNRVLVDSLGEAAQDVNVLLQWHNEDPPDAWEKSRNEYVYSIQGNRNPFIDHPEYANVIDFNTLTKKTTVTLAAEPTYYQHGFGYFTPTLTDTSITVQWADTTGAVLPTGYILFANTSGTFSDPSDGVVYTDDTDLSDGSAAVNIAYSEPDSFRFGGLTSGTSYYFKIFPYNGTGNQRNYKTDNFPSFTSYIMYTTTGAGAAFTSVVVNEYMNGSDQTTEWVELLVQQNNLDMRGMKLRDYSGSGSTGAGIVFSNDNLWSAVPIGSFIVVLAATNTQTQDLSFSGDKKVIVSATNSTYFSGTSFNIAGSNDGVEILNSGGTHIHSLSHGSKPGNIATLPTPTANITGSSTSGNVVRFINISSNADFGSDAHAQHSSTATQGSANDASQTNYISSVLPVELVTFSGSVINGHVMLQWNTATELNNYGFEIERKTIGGWTTIGFVEGNGTTNISHAYSFVDRSADGRSVYRLRQIDRDGAFQYSNEIEVMNGQLPQKFTLNQNYPNPFNPSTTIQFALVRAEHVTMTVFNSLGQAMQTIVNNDYQPGTYDVQFNGSSYASGTYFYRLTAGEFSATKSFVLMK